MKHTTRQHTPKTIQTTEKNVQRNTIKDKPTRNQTAHATQQTTPHRNATHQAYNTKHNAAHPTRNGTQYSNK